MDSEITAARAGASVLAVVAVVAEAAGLAAAVVVKLEEEPVPTRPLAAAAAR